MPNLIREYHQPRVEHDRQQYMRSNDQAQGDDQRPVPSWNLIVKRHGAGREDDHHRNDQEADDVRQLEVVPNAGDLEPER